jgi:glycosyltransferase involved in cell wall biosynthesis
VKENPLLSFIVLSYNYEEYIGAAIESILKQTVQDFEVIVVDDASHDNSCAIVESFNDARIRLFRNEVNLGGARSYNRAVELARGEWLSNLDADDWIAPEKSAIQLAALKASPAVDIIGTHVSFFDGNGKPHPAESQFAEHTNAEWDLNILDSWITENRLCRSSTMIRRSTHLQIGLDDPNMVRAPDYELWTRALRLGCRFLVIPEKLTCVRIQSRGVTHGDPIGAAVEKAWIGLHNLRPHAERMSAWPSFEKIISTVAYDSNLAGLKAAQRYRLFAALFLDVPFEDFSHFRRYLDAEDLAMERVGRRLFAVSLGRDSAKDRMIEKLYTDIGLYIEAREYWQGVAAGTAMGSAMLAVKRIAKRFSNSFPRG